MFVQQLCQINIAKNTSAAPVQRSEINQIQVNDGVCELLGPFCGSICNFWGFNADYSLHIKTYYTDFSIGSRKKSKLGKIVEDSNQLEAVNRLGEIYRSILGYNPSRKGPRRLFLSKWLTGNVTIESKLLIELISFLIVCRNMKNSFSRFTTVVLSNNFQKPILISNSNLYRNSY